jgi:hypothetical protein
MLLLSWQLTVLSLGTLPFFFWLTQRVGRARREVAAVTQKSMADLSAITEETLSVSGILLSKAFGRQRYETERFRRENERLAGLQIRQQMIGRSFFATIQIFFSITPALVYLVAGFVLQGGGGGQHARLGRARRGRGGPDPPRGQLARQCVARCPWPSSRAMRARSVESTPSSPISRTHSAGKTPASYHSGTRGSTREDT